jgi:hypothetical protein
LFDTDLLLLLLPSKKLRYRLAVSSRPADIGLISFMYFDDLSPKRSEELQRKDNIPSERGSFESSCIA